MKCYLTFKHWSPHLGSIFVPYWQLSAGVGGQKEVGEQWPRPTRASRSRAMKVCMLTWVGFYVGGQTGLLLTLWRQTDIWWTRSSTPRFYQIGHFTRVGPWPQHAGLWFHVTRSGRPHAVTEHFHGESTDSLMCPDIFQNTLTIQKTGRNVPPTFHQHQPAALTPWWWSLICSI